MKRIELSYHNSFPWTPVSHWVGARGFAWVNPNQSIRHEQWRRPVLEKTHPFIAQRKKWCLMQAHFNAVDLRFATPQELDHFLDVIGQNPLPSGSRLTAKRIGRPFNHWLTTLPKRAKPWRFRKPLVEFLSNHRKTTEFKQFYEAQPVIFEFDGYFSSAIEAINARLKTEKTT